MASDHTDELEGVAEILLQLPRLIFDSEIRTMFPLAWLSKKQRTTRKFADPLSGWKNPISFPNSKQGITRKRKGSENRLQNSSTIGGTKERLRFCAVKDESSKRNKISRSSNSSADFLIPDLNLPLLIGGGVENCQEHEAQKPTQCLRA